MTTDYDNSRKDFSDYVLFTLDRIRENLNKELTTLTAKIEKWTQTQ